MYLPNTIFAPAQLLLPVNSVDLQKWAVIACDQFTSQPEYWNQVEQIVDQSPSTLHLILPEIYLGKQDESNRIEKIRHAMNQYLNNGTFYTTPPAFVRVERTLSNGIIRRGLIGTVDLEAYDYSAKSTTPIRATEGTVIERLPPRIRVRDGAPLESPHIMILIDDPAKTVIEPLFEKSLPIAYQTKLMLDGGSIQGALVNSNEDIQQIQNALSSLFTDSTTRYSGGNGHFVYAVGDGNHSLATAKSIWESLKAKGASHDHPARFALCEIVNIHDQSLNFEPIHRVVFNVNVQSFLEKLASSLSANIALTDKLDINAASARSQIIPFAHSAGFGTITITNPVHILTCSTLQHFLDHSLDSFSGAALDYIHGDAALLILSKKENTLGFFLPPISKHSFFQSIYKDGTLPRKTFSIGHAQDKRYYFECRSIIHSH